MWLAACRYRRRGPGGCGMAHLVCVIAGPQVQALLRALALPRGQHHVRLVCLEERRGMRAECVERGSGGGGGRPAVGGKPSALAGTAARRSRDLRDAGPPTSAWRGPQTRSRWLVRLGAFNPRPGTAIGLYLIHSGPRPPPAPTRTRHSPQSSRPAWWPWRC